MKRFASHYLVVAANQMYKQYVVEMQGEFVYRIFPLHEEVESASFFCGLLFLSPVKIDCELVLENWKSADDKKQNIIELLIEKKLLLTQPVINEFGRLEEVSVYLYLVEHLDLSNFHLLPESYLRRLAIA